MKFRILISLSKPINKVNIIIIIILDNLNDLVRYNSDLKNTNFPYTRYGRYFRRKIRIFEIEISVTLLSNILIKNIINILILVAPKFKVVNLMIYFMLDLLSPTFYTSFYAPPAGVCRRTQEKK